MMRNPGNVCRRSLAVVFCGAMLAVAPLPAQTQADTPQTDNGQAPPAGYGGPRRGGPDGRAEMLQHHLNLSPDQTTQVRQLLEGERSQMQALHSNTSLSPADRHSQMMSLHQDTEGKIRGLLTPDQATKYDAMQARMRAHRQERQDGGMPDGGAPQPPQ